MWVFWKLNTNEFPWNLKLCVFCCFVKMWQPCRKIVMKMENDNTEEKQINIQLKKINDVIILSF